MATPIRGQTRPLPIKAGLIETKKINADINASIHNRFDVEVVEAQTGKIKQRAHGENVICSQLWTRLFTPATYFGYIHYGTGSGTPAVADTSLFAFLGYGIPAVADDVYAYNRTGGYYSLRRKIQLSETTAVGSTITEVGIGYSTTAATLCTHAMLKDANGNQISIAKTSTDIINIYATVFVHIGSYDSGNIVIEQPIFNYSASAATYGPIQFWLLGISSGIKAYPVFSPGGIFQHTLETLTDGYVGAVMTTTFSSSNKTLTLTATRVAVASANIGHGFGSIMLCDYGYKGYMPWTPMIGLKVGGSWLASSAITGEPIGTGDGTTVDFQTGFDRISNATIYVNGVAQSGVTVGNNLPFNYTDMGRYFEQIEIGVSSGVYNSEFTVPTPIAQVCYPIYDTWANVGNYAIFYNPFYSYGIKSFSQSCAGVYVSDDLTTWVDITSQTANVSAAYRTYKYWKVVSTLTSSGTSHIFNMAADTITSSNNIHFATPPASGAVITADYTTKTIAKDANHVFDLTVTINLGEYSA